MDLVDAYKYWVSLPKRDQLVTPEDVKLKYPFAELEVRRRVRPIECLKILFPESILPFISSELPPFEDIYKYMASVALILAHKEDSMKFSGKQHKFQAFYRWMKTKIKSELSTSAMVSFERFKALEVVLRFSPNFIKECLSTTWSKTLASWGESIVADATFKKWTYLPKDFKILHSSAANSRPNSLQTTHLLVTLVDTNQAYCVGLHVEDPVELAVSPLHNESTLIKSGLHQDLLNWVLKIVPNQNRFPILIADKFYGSLNFVDGLRKEKRAFSIFVQSTQRDLHWKRLEKMLNSPESFGMVKSCEFDDVIAVKHQNSPHRLNIDREVILTNAIKPKEKTKTATDLNPLVDFLIDLHTRASSAASGFNKHLLKYFYMQGNGSWEKRLNAIALTTLFTNCFVMWTWSNVGMGQSNTTFSEFLYDLAQNIFEECLSKSDLNSSSGYGRKKLKYD